MNLPRVIVHLPRIILIALIFTGAPLLIVLIASSANLLPTPRPDPTPKPTPVLSEVPEPSNWQYRTGTTVAGELYVAASIAATQHYSNHPDSQGEGKLTVLCFPDSRDFTVYVDFGANVSEGKEQIDVEYYFGFAQRSYDIRPWSFDAGSMSATAPDAIRVSFALQAVEERTLRVTVRTGQTLPTILTTILRFELQGKANPWHPVLQVLEACGEA